jgi:hypothetical protein
MRENRSQLIAEHVLLAISRSSLTERTYGQTVADLYMERTALHARTVTFAVSADPYADQVANCQIVKRMLDGRTRMPVDVEEALIFALPDPYRHQLQAELAARLGLMAAELPAHHAAGQQQQVGDLVRAVGHALDKLSNMLDDGVLDEHDLAYAPDALRDLEDVQARAATLCDAIRQNVLERGGSLRRVK